LLSSTGFDRQAPAVMSPCSIFHASGLHRVPVEAGTLCTIYKLITNLTTCGLSPLIHIVTVTQMQPHKQGEWSLKHNTTHEYMFMKIMKQKK
jgi:hypothetical protein